MEVGSWKKNFQLPGGQCCHRAVALFGILSCFVVFAYQLKKQKSRIENLLCRERTNVS